MVRAAPNEQRDGVTHYSYGEGNLENLRQGCVSRLDCERRGDKPKEEGPI